MEKKVVLITGASRGIGAEIAKKFAKENYRVVINYNNSKSEAELLASSLISFGYDCICIKADVANACDVKNMVNEVLSTYGHIDVLVCCAGVSNYNLLIDENEENIRRVIDVNLIGTILTCKEVAGHMIKRNQGKIINISSIWGLCGASNESIYSASKGGIDAFTKSLAKELCLSNINVNGIAPGIVKTDMISRFKGKELDDLINEIPFKRLASTSDISNLCYFLASDEASYITGQIIQIDGGFCL